MSCTLIIYVVLLCTISIVNTVFGIRLLPIILVSLCYFDIVYATADELVNDASKIYLSGTDD